MTVRGNSLLVLPQTGLAAPQWAEAQDPHDWLTEPELARCGAAVAPRRRTDRIAGRLALKRLLRDAFGVPPLNYEIGSDGPAPALAGWPGPAGLVVSLSHSHGLGAASWCWEREERTVGVDAQQIRPVHPGLTARVLTDHEQAQGADLLLLWALKEAAIKARRRPWGRALRDIEITVADPAAKVGTAQIRLPDEPPLRAHYALYRAANHAWWIARATC